jgi:N-terminal domain of anti-restriction factor ArdC
MSRSAARARPGQDRTSLYQEITDKIIGELEAGRVPWVQPWGTAAAQAPLAMPKNAATERHYSGINVLILWGAVIEHGFAGQSWLTFRQALGLGGNVHAVNRPETISRLKSPQSVTTLPTISDASSAPAFVLGLFASWSGRDHCQWASPRLRLQSTRRTKKAPGFLRGHFLKASASRLSHRPAAAEGPRGRFR